MKVKRIFLDVDDVLADFTLAAMEYVGCAVSQEDKDDFYDSWGFDIVAAVNALHPSQNFSPKEFWAQLPKEFWAQLSKTRECDWIINTTVRGVGRDNVFLLTSPINDPECVAGKMEWIRDFLPSWFWENRQYIIAPPKWVCARPDALLIDDSDANIRRFREEGGLAILLPRPWNSLHAFQGLELVLDPGR